MRLSILGFICLLASCSFAQQAATFKAVAHPSDDPPATLVASTDLLLNIPAFVPVGAPACDTSGDMFFNITSKIGDLGPFLKIRHDASKHTVFDLPYDERDWGGVDMTVSPDGVFYVMHSSLKKHAFTLLRYRDDGTIAERTIFDIPWSARIQQFAITNSGVVYVGGYTENGDEKKTSRSIRPCLPAGANSSGI